MLNLSRYAILMLIPSLLDAQYFDAKFVPTVNPPKGYFIDLSISLKSDGKVILKKSRPVLAKQYKCKYQATARQLQLSGKDCVDMVRNSGGNLTDKALQPILSEDGSRLTFYQSKSTVTFSKKK